MIAVGLDPEVVKNSPKPKMQRIFTISFILQYIMAYCLAMFLGNETDAALGAFYGFLTGIELESASPRRFGPPAHDQRGKHQVTAAIQAPRGLGTVEDFKRLQRLAPKGPGAPTLKASVPGPYTLGSTVRLKISTKRFVSSLCA